ncbi:hypothetical protein BV898_06848 [Hypsibius exemplaris]|uniref:Tctex1 domain-containing protein 1 n=1 Tax=Hypsibius exemplaris TaxID=2072580 RepID=A0A1W0WVP8_HYPEX|nr:hypothetical protein BV898_06848 [Hypsibius exemplaris]
MTEPEPKGTEGALAAPPSDSPPTAADQAPAEPPVNAVSPADIPVSITTPSGGKKASTSAVAAATTAESAKKDSATTVAPPAKKDSILTVAPPAKKDSTTTVAPPAKKDSTTTVAPPAKKNSATTVASPAKKDSTTTVAPPATTEKRSTSGAAATVAPPADAAENIAVVEVDAAERDSVELLFGEKRPSKGSLAQASVKGLNEGSLARASVKGVNEGSFAQASVKGVNEGSFAQASVKGVNERSLKLTDENGSEVMSSVDYSVQTAAYAGEEPTAAVIEKQPAIGQLQLKELLSGTSMKIVEYAQKLAEAPLIGTMEETPLPPPPQPAQQAFGVPSGAGLPTAGEPGGEPQQPQGKKSSAAQMTNRFPEPDHDEMTAPTQLHQQSALNTVLVQEDEAADTEPYETYCVPEGMDKMEEVPAILRRYTQAFQDEKQPVAKIFKLEDEDKLNEAAGWDIQPSYRSKPECVIRCAVLKKILQGLLEFRLAKTTIEFDGRQPKMILQNLCEDIATTLAQLRFPSYKYGYFVTLGQRNHQDVIVSTRQLWDPETDRRVIARFENSQLHASIIVHFIFHP